MTSHNVEEVNRDAVIGAADMLALFTGQLMDGPPNGTHMTLRAYLAQWRLVQGALDEYHAARRGEHSAATSVVECHSCDQLMAERDAAEEMCDRLAEKIAGLEGLDIGEHSSGNCPWTNALNGENQEPA